MLSTNKNRMATSILASLLLAVTVVRVQAQVQHQYQGDDDLLAMESGSDVSWVDFARPPQQRPASLPQVR